MNSMHETSMDMQQNIPDQVDCYENIKNEKETILKDLIDSVEPMRIMSFQPPKQRTNK